MIRADMIPDEVFYAFQKAWADKSTLSTKECLAAALQAWPGVKESKVQVPDDSDEIRYTLKTTGIILPLPQENTNEKV